MPPGGDETEPDGSAASSTSTGDAGSTVGTADATTSVDATVDAGAVLDVGTEGPLDATTTDDAAASDAGPSDASDAVDAAGDAGPNDASDAADAAGDAADASDGAAEACVPLPSGLVTLAPAQNFPYTLVAAGGSVFWTNASSGQVMRASPDGCSIVPVASGQVEPIGLAVDSANVYFTSDGAVLSVAIDGGTVATLATNQAAPYMLTVNAGIVYWTNDVEGSGSIWAWADDAAAPFATNQNYPGNLVAIPSGVYWGTYDGNVVVAPLDGGAVATIASGQLTPRFLASDGVNVFWTDTTAGNVLQMNPDGGEPIALASGQANPNGIATDGTNVYFTNQGVSGSSTPFGSVYRVPVGGGSPAAKIADGPSGLGFVTVDATSVYWIAGGSIMKLTPK